MLGIKLYETYNKAKEFFTAPTVHFSFGKWKNNHCLPVWRRGPIIKLGGSVFNHNAKCYLVKDRVSICTGQTPYTNSKGETYYHKTYAYTEPHKLPRGLKQGDVVWRRDIRKKLKKFGLGWIKPQYKLPIWLAFHIFNHDVGWKTKYGDTRYEYAPQFTIVFFGLAFSVWLKAPACKTSHFHDDQYWEGVIDYSFYKNKKDFDPIRFIKGQGYMHWTEYLEFEKAARAAIFNKYKDDKGFSPIYNSEEYKKMHDELAEYPGIEMAAMCIREEYLRKDKLEYFHKAFEEVKEKNNKYKWIW